MGRRNGNVRGVTGAAGGIQLTYFVDTGSGYTQIWQNSINADKWDEMWQTTAFIPWDAERVKFRFNGRSAVNDNFFTRFSLADSGLEPTVFPTVEDEPLLVEEESSSSLSTAGGLSSSSTLNSSSSSSSQSTVSSLSTSSASTLTSSSVSSQSYSSLSTSST